MSEPTSDMLWLVVRTLEKAFLPDIVVICEARDHRRPAQHCEGSKDVILEQRLQPFAASNASNRFGRQKVVHVRQRHREAGRRGSSLRTRDCERSNAQETHEAHLLV
jgi:hypothetical protein